MRAYVYKILFSDGKWYYGIRRFLHEEPQSDGYYGSPVTNKKHWGLPHSKIVLKIFDDLEEAAKYENSLIRPDLNNPMCLNECANLTFSYEVNKRAREKAAVLRKGNPLTEEHKSNISTSQKGRKASPQEQERLRNLTVGMTWWNDGTKEVLVYDSPGLGWVRGRLKGCFGGSTRTSGWKWYNKDGERKMFKENPGGDWKLGRNGFNPHANG